MRLWNDVRLRQSGADLPGSCEEPVCGNKIGDARIHPLCSAHSLARPGTGLWLAFSSMGITTLLFAAHGRIERRHSISPGTGRSYRLGEQRRRRCKVEVLPNESFAKILHGQRSFPAIARLPAS